jgi:hypothetical protein
MHCNSSLEIFAAPTFDELRWGVFSLESTDSAAALSAG